MKLTAEKVLLILFFVPLPLLPIEFNQNYYQNTAKPLFRKYCFQCHHRESSTPFYAKPFKSINPFYQDIEEGRKALDMSSGYPGFKSSGTSSPLTLLQEIKNVLQDERMPPKAYSFFHGQMNWHGFSEGFISLGPTQKERAVMINWARGAQKLITRNKRDRFQRPEDHIKYIFEKKCYYCHNPNYTKQNGTLKDIMDLEFLKKNFTDPNFPERSKLYLQVSPQIGKDGKLKIKMPGRGDPLTTEEIKTVLEWIKSQYGK